MTDDLVYRRLEAGLSWLAANQLRRVLVTGAPDDRQVAALESLDGDVREMGTREDVELCRGVYGIYRRGGWDAVVVLEGDEAATEASARYRHTDDGPRKHLGDARQLLDDEFDDAKPMLGSSPLAVRDMVRVVGRNVIGRVQRVQRMGEGHQITVSIDGQLQHFISDSLVRIEGDPRDPRFWCGEAPASANDIALTLTQTKLRNPLTDTLYSFAATKTVFRPYQFIPAIKILSSPSAKLLIADEVGLGKTIEAGLIWTELEQRHRMRRTLVVCPSSLTLKWQIEMRRRFDRPLEVIKPRRLAELADDLRSGGDPELHGIISLQSLRTADEVIAQLNEVHARFDLVIVDEAHAMRNKGRRSNDLGKCLSDWADCVLFLSATPINLRSEDLFNLLSILDEGQFHDFAVFQDQLEPNSYLNAVARDVARGEEGPQLASHLERIKSLPLGGAVVARPEFSQLREVLSAPRLDAPARAEAKRLVAELNTLGQALTRTRKVDVPDDKAVREPHNVEVRWTAQEKDFYDAVFAHFMQQAMERGLTPGFALQMPLRQAASCLPAMQDRLLRRLRLDNPVEDVAAQFSWEPDILDDPDDEGTDERQLDELARVPVLMRNLGTDTKLVALKEQLRELRALGSKQAMIFSTFRPTIAYLQRELEAEFSVRSMHGGTPMDDRQPLMDAFRDGRFDILIVSEVGSEGLDFQFCNVLVNYDLPWNPMRVEQRIGRLDRFGQTSEKIFIFNMHVPGTIEADILSRLYERIEIFRGAIGDLEPILQEEGSSWLRQLLDPTLSAEQRKQRSDEIAIAWETKGKQLQQLQDSRGLLSTMDQLEVDGLDQNGPTNGRYVGPSEVERLVRDLLRRTDGQLLSKPGTKGVFLLRGTPSLSELLWDARRREVGGGSKFAAGVLQGLVRDGTPLDVTFDAALASGHDLELISSRHPLVEAALLALEKDPLHLRAFGRIAVPTARPGSRYVAQVDLVETTGARPVCEMWATVLDTRTGEPVEEVAGVVLESLAAGTVRDPDVDEDLDMSMWLGRLEEAVSVRHRQEEDRRRQENLALVQARRESKEHSLRVKISRAEEVLDKVRREGRKPQLLRLHEGRIRNLKAELEQVPARLKVESEMSMQRRTVAVLDIFGSD